MTDTHDGGGFRAHLSRDVLNETTCSVDELDPDDTSFDPTPGHGTVVTGIAAATTDNGIFKYVLDGIEGYVYEHCGAGCPPETVALHRLYNSSRHDTVIVPESEVAAMMSQGYLSPPDPDLKEIVGYALPNVDSDGDGLIDGFERLIGTVILDPDSDADGVSDGQVRPARGAIGSERPSGA